MRELHKGILAGGLAVGVLAAALIAVAYTRLGGGNSASPDATVATALANDFTACITERFAQYNTLDGVVLMTLAKDGGAAVLSGVRDNSEVDGHAILDRALAEIKQYKNYPINRTNITLRQDESASARDPAARPGYHL